MKKNSKVEAEVKATYKMKKTPRSKPKLKLYKKIKKIPKIDGHEFTNW